MIGRDRPDGTRVHNLPRLRRIMPYVMPRRADALVFFEQVLDLTQTQAYLDRWNADSARPPLTLFQVMIAAAVHTLHERPRLNRFVAGRRLWQRDVIEVSISVIKAKDDDARLTVVKESFTAGQGLTAIGARVDGAAANGRGAQRTASEKEVDLVTRLPRSIIDLLFWMQRVADHWNLLPASLIHNDPLYSSLMVTNLGSIGIDAAWHHLYEHGTLGLFLAMGKAQPMPFVTAAGGVEARHGLTLRYAFDERIADGFYAARSLDLLRSLVEEPWRMEHAADHGPGAGTA